MNVQDQGVRESRRRYQAIPRTLVFLTSANPATGQQEVLLLRGAPTKRLWANKYNGLGGHVEADEDMLAAALREVVEETGLTPATLTLRGVVNIDTGRDPEEPRPGVLMFVFWGQSTERTVKPSTEGAAEWIPIARLNEYPLVDDLYEVLPRALRDGPLFFGRYTPRPDGSLIFLFADELKT